MPTRWSSQVPHSSPPTFDFSQKYIQYNIAKHICLMNSSVDVTLTSESFSSSMSPTKSSPCLLSSFLLHYDNQLSSLTSHYFLQATSGYMKCLDVTLVQLLLLFPSPERIHLHCYLLKSYPPFQVKL